MSGIRPLPFKSHRITVEPWQKEEEVTLIKTVRHQQTQPHGFFTLKTPLRGVQGFISGPGGTTVDQIKAYIGASRLLKNAAHEGTSRDFVKFKENLLRVATKANIEVDSLWLSALQSINAKRNAADGPNAALFEGADTTHDALLKKIDKYIDGAERALNSEREDRLPAAREFFNKGVALWFKSPKDEKPLVIGIDRLRQIARIEKTLQSEEQVELNQKNRDVVDQIKKDPLSPLKIDN